MSITASRRRRRRSRVLSVAIAAVVTAGAIALSIVSSSPAVDHGAESRMQQVLARIPQQDFTLGKSSAPVTVFEFADLQCPYCARYMQTIFPKLVADDVEPGKVKMVLDTVWLLGNGSRWGALAAAAAAGQSKMWNFADAFFYNQGPENSGYVTPGFIREIGSEVPGLDVARMMTDFTGPVARARLKALRAFAQAHGVQATPTFMVVDAHGQGDIVVGSAKLEATIDRALARSGRKSSNDGSVD